MDDGLDTVLVDRRNVLLGELEMLLRCKEIHLSQKAKCKWLKEGDVNMKLFHRIANGKKRESLITRLCVQGDEVEDLDCIKDEDIGFFGNLYAKENKIRLTIENLFLDPLSVEVARSIKNSSFRDEVKNAIFSMAADKSTGPPCSFNNNVGSDESIY